MTLTLNILLVFLSVISHRMYCVWAHNTRLMDIPNERSLHTYPTIRGGGLVFICLFLCSFPLMCTKLPVVFMLSTILIAGISFADDLYHLSARVRFLVQSMAVLGIVFFIRPGQLEFVVFSCNNPYFIGLFLGLTLMWAINHFNFMDGLDGFCAMQSICLLAAYAFFFSLTSDVTLQSLCWLLVSSLSGFLILNFPPAKVFMGDVGSASLGFIIFVIAIMGQKEDQIPIIYWFILNGLFLFDATMTLFRRIWNKEKWFLPHKKHAYQRIKQFGWASKPILLGQMLLNIVFFILVVLQHYMFLHLGMVILIQLGILLCIYLVIERCFPMYDRL